MKGDGAMKDEIPWKGCFYFDGLASLVGLGATTVLEERQPRRGFSLSL